MFNRNYYYDLIVRHDHVVAVYWADNDARLNGRVSWEMYTTGASPTSDGIITKVNGFIARQSGVYFNGRFMFVVTWKEMHPYPAGDDLGEAEPYLNMVCDFFYHTHFNILTLFTRQNNTYQGILITDGEEKSFAVFIFKCGSLNWAGSSATIGRGKVFC